MLKKNKILDRILIGGEHEAACSPNGKHQLRWNNLFLSDRINDENKRIRASSSPKRIMMESLIGIREEAQC